MSVRVSGPLERIETMLTEGARGMFANHVAMRARDEIGDLVAALNRALRDLRQRYEDFQFDVREIKDAQIDRGIVERIRTACQPVEDRYRFDGGEELRPRNAMQIRVPLFLFMFAEELPRSFLPLFIARLSPTDSVISNELLFGLPITLFMLAGMVVVPLGGGLADRFGARQVFLACIVPATIGYFGTFLAQGYYDLVGWRILSGHRLRAHLHRRPGLGRRQHGQPQPRPGDDRIRRRGLRRHHLRAVHRRHLRGPHRLRSDVPDLGPGSRRSPGCSSTPCWTRP